MELACNCRGTLWNIQDRDVFEDSKIVESRRESNYIVDWGSFEFRLSFKSVEMSQIPLAKSIAQA